MILLKISLFVIVVKTISEPSIKGTLRYQKINFLTISVPFNNICLKGEDNETTGFDSNGQ